MRAPMLLLVLELEAKPRLVLLAQLDEETRLLDWLRGDPRIADLLGDAVQIITEPTTANES